MDGTVLMCRPWAENQTPSQTPKLLLHGSTNGRAHSEKIRSHCWKLEDIKNYDRNGPEGQFIAASTTTCNAGFPLYGAGIMISAQSIKVSMKKKKKRRGSWGGERGLYTGWRWSVHVCECANGLCSAGHRPGELRSSTPPTHHLLPSGFGA